jgi:hypothetical protein
MAERSFTLDTNGIIAVANGEPETAAVRALAASHAVGRAQVAVVAISASEQARGDTVLTNFADFQSWLTGLGLGHLDILRPMAYWDVTSGRASKCRR